MKFKRCVTCLDSKILTAFRLMHGKYRLNECKQCEIKKNTAKRSTKWEYHPEWAFLLKLPMRY